MRLHQSHGSAQPRHTNMTKGPRYAGGYTGTGCCGRGSPARTCHRHPDPSPAHHHEQGHIDPQAGSHRSTSSAAMSHPRAGSYYRSARYTRLACTGDRIRFDKSPCEHQSTREYRGRFMGGTQAGIGIGSWVAPRAWPPGPPAREPQSDRGACGRPRDAYAGMQARA